MSSMLSSLCKLREVELYQKFRQILHPGDISVELLMVGKFLVRREKPAI
jgi:hypothetical protein